MQADLLLRSGKWFSPEIGSPRAGGVAIAGDRIVARGPDAELEAWRGPRTRVIDLRGRLVTPGFNDAHIHFSEGGLSLLEVDCRPARSAEDLGALAAARAAEIGDGRWISGRGWDHHRFPGERLPTAAALDRACPRNPVIFRRVCGHAAVASTAALAAAGIGRETPDPPGGRIGRLPSGAPDGLLFETAIDLVRAKVPPPGPEEKRAALALSLARARAVGLTSVQDERGWLDIYERLLGERALTVRASVWNRVAAPLDELLAWRAEFEARRLGPRVRPGLLKGYLDGSLGARTALFFEPYADDPSTAGVAVLAAEEAHALVARAHAAGFQVGLHAIGDRAVATALDAFEAAARTHGSRDLRHRIEHAQNVRHEDLPRFAALGAVASMQPSHCSGDIGFVAARLGPARLPQAYPWRLLLRAGARIAFGSDFPIESMDPRTGLYAALTRLGWSGEGEPLVAEERLTMAEAIDLFTRGAAWAEHQESEKGTLEPGKLADLVVFGADLFAIAPREVLEAPVELTVVGGEIVHEKDA